MITQPNQTYYMTQPTPPDEDPEELRNTVIRFVLGVVLMVAMSVAGVFILHFLFRRPW